MADMTLAVPASERSENIRGIVGMLVAMAVFVLNDTLMKLAAAHLPTGEAIFLRGVFTVGFCLALIYVTNLSWALPLALSPRVALRSLMDIGGTMLFLLALVHMPLGTFSASCSSRHWRSPRPQPCSWAPRWAGGGGWRQPSG